APETCARAESKRAAQQLKRARAESKRAAQQLKRARAESKRAAQQLKRARPAQSRAIMVSSRTIDSLLDRNLVLYRQDQVFFWSITVILIKNEKSTRHNGRKIIEKQEKQYLSYIDLHILS